MDAVIDIGSNSVRLAFMKGDVNPKKINTTFLAEGLASSGFLSMPAIERTANAVHAFYQTAKRCEPIWRVAYWRTGS